jgi:hypothetical protein
MDDQTESDEKILAFDVPDEAVERAASAERQGTTATGHSSVQRNDPGSLATLRAIVVS